MTVLLGLLALLVGLFVAVLLAGCYLAHVYGEYERFWGEIDE